MTARRRRKLLLLVPVAAALAGAGWLLFRPVAVEVAPVVRGRVVATVYASGTVEADPRVDVRPRVGGTAAEILADEGRPVKKGDLLVRLENPQLRWDAQRTDTDLAAARARVSGNSPQLRARQAELRAAEAILAEAERSLAEAERLAAAGAAPKTEVDARRAARDRARAERDAAAERLRATRADLDAERKRLDAIQGSAAATVADTEVRAPIDGVVIRRRVDPGELVSAGQPLVTVGDTANLILEVKVDEADVGELRVGQLATATLYAYEGRVFAGRVVELAPDADRETKTYLAKIRLDDPPDGLRSGMTVEANIVVGEAQDAVLVPSAAVRGDRVWVVEGHRAYQRRIELGIRELTWIEVRSGLMPGERVVVGSRRPDRQGLRVRPSERPSPAPGAKVAVER